MTLSRSVVAACCSCASFSSRMSCATSVWPAGAEPRRGMASVLWPLGFNALRRCTLTGLPPAREGFFIASTHMAGNEAS